MRVIARLNMGGPALHVAYLTKGLAERGYDTTLVAGSLARGESSMAFVAEELGVEVEPLPQLSREISPVYDPLSVLRLVHEIAPQHPTAFGHLLQGLHWYLSPMRPLACPLPAGAPAAAAQRG